MINVLANICGEGSNLQAIWNIVNVIVNVIMVGVPILLIIFGMVDLGKAVIASKEDEVKKSTKLLGKRFLYAIGVFAVVWVVRFVFDTVAGVVDNDNFGYKEDSNDKDYDYGANDWRTCWSCNIRKGGKNCK